MNAAAASKTVAALVSGTLLSGCVAAAAIPVLASGAIVRTETDGVEPNVTAAQTEPLRPIDAPQSAPSPVAASSFPLIDLSSSSAAITFNRFLFYAETQAGALDAEEFVLSSQLQDPGALDAQRVPCENGDASILIDIDPKGSLFSASDVDGAPPQMISGLAGLRAQGISIGWVSGQSAAEAGAIRDVLTKTGLDPQVQDTLVLLRYPDDRKQTRRADWAESSCLLAILGDEKADFDELYEFISNPNAALELEVIFNDGWFLVAPEAALEVEPEQATSANDKDQTQ